MKIAIIGAGCWGTALAQSLSARDDLKVCLWAREKELTETLRSKRENPLYMPGVSLSPKIEYTNELEEALDKADLFVFVVPSQKFREVLHKAKKFFPQKSVRPHIVCASKGIELSTLLPMSKVAADVMSDRSYVYASLSGPSFAAEVIRYVPTAISLGCSDELASKRIQEILSTSTFRVYTNKDVLGVELGGALKNVIAIATGILDGLGLGNNARAALITRGLSEISRLGEAMGANPKTFMGLSGLGDLILTCTGDLSRNRQVGLKLAAGLSLKEILTNMHTVAEGVSTADAMYDLGKKLKVALPITEQVRSIFHKGKSPGKAAHELMTRDLKGE